MGSFLSLPVLILVASIQASVTPHIRFWDGAPDLVFLFVLIRQHSFPSSFLKLCFLEHRFEISNISL